MKIALQYTFLLFGVRRKSNILFQFFLILYYFQCNIKDSNDPLDHD